MAFQIYVRYYHDIVAAKTLTKFRTADGEFVSLKFVKEILINKEVDKQWYKRDSSFRAYNHQSSEESMLYVQDEAGVEYEAHLHTAGDLGDEIWQTTTLFFTKVEHKHDNT